MTRASGTSRNEATKRLPTMSPGPERARRTPRRRTKDGGRSSWITAVAFILCAGGLLVWRAESRTNKIALDAAPKPVTATPSAAERFQPSRSYVGRLEPWLVASVGPQLVSAYVDTVLVRPGAIVKRGRPAQRSTAATRTRRTRPSGRCEARAIDARQKAAANEAARVQGAARGGSFVSPNEAEMKTAQSAAGGGARGDEAQRPRAEGARGERLRPARALRRGGGDPHHGSRRVRAAGDGHRLHRRPEHGAAHGRRARVRLRRDRAGPQGDDRRRHQAWSFSAATISRRAPAADPSTRTVHFEVDLPDPEREIPVGTTGVVHLDVGEPEPATEIPLYAASVRGTKAMVFVIDGDVAHARRSCRSRARSAASSSSSTSPRGRRADRDRRGGRCSTTATG